MMIDGLNVFYAGLEAKWCAFTQQEHRAALARELDLPKYTKFSTAWYGRTTGMLLLNFILSLVCPR